MGLVSASAKVVVMRLADKPVAPVPSRKVECADCEEPCWLSERTERRVRLNFDFATVKIQCGPCMIAEAKNH